MIQCVPVRILEISLANFKNAKQPAKDLYYIFNVVCCGLLGRYILRGGRRDDHSHIMFSDSKTENNMTDFLRRRLHFGFSCIVMLFFLSVCNIQFIGQVFLTSFFPSKYFASSKGISYRKIIFSCNHVFKYPFR